MMGRSSPLRSLGSVMVVTLHVAVVAYLIRALTRPASLVGSFVVWVPITIVLAVFLSWPIGRAIAGAFDPSTAPEDRSCPRCGLRTIRPSIRDRDGVFLPAEGYRCQACRSTFREVDGRFVEESGPSRTNPVDPSGIEFVAELTDAEIQFLDEAPDSRS